MAGAASIPDGEGRFDDVISDLILLSYELHPDAVATTLADHLGRLGLRDATILVVDLSQKVLSPLRNSPLPQVYPVDGPGPGEAFRREVPVVDAAPDGRRVWVPLLDSAERIGVLGATVDELTAEATRNLQVVASYLGELVVSKATYGDGITLARRTGPTTLAAEMRWALLPPLNFVSPQVTVSGLLEPAYEIAGDAFDYAVNDGIVHLAILDAMGHGLEASRMASLAVAAYRHGRRAGRTLSEIVASMDLTIGEQFGPNKFVTGQLATLDTHTGSFCLLNLGHPLPLLLRDGAVTGALDAKPGAPVGLGWVPATVVETQLQPGDLVLLHTDGITEARGSGSEEFGQARFEELVGELLARGEAPAELLRRVVDEVLAFQDHRARDDATLLLVGWQIPPRGSSMVGSNRR